MKKLTLLLLIILNLSCFSQELSVEINTRSSKIDTVFDWYAGITIKDSVLKCMKYELSSNIERDRGTLYYSYKGDIQHEYFKISHINDTEKDIIISSANLFYPIKIKKATIKLGFDASYTDVFLGGGYIGVKYKFVSIETAFFDTFYKFTYKIEPKLKLNEYLSVSVFVKGVLVEDKYKWRNGLKLNIEL